MCFGPILAAGLLLLTVDGLLSNGVRRIDFLVHGISKGGGGWRPFATREDFVKYLDGVREAEKSGKIAVSAEYRLDGAAPRKGCCGLQAEIDRCSEAGGGVVRVAHGRTTMQGVLKLRDNVTLELADDSEICFPDDPSLYGASPALVYAEGVTNVAIVGGGVIRARGDRWHREVYKAKLRRPRFFQFRRCEDVRLDGFRVRGSPMWTIHLLMSRKVLLRGLDVFARGYNTDGVDVDSSQDVLIEDCRLDQGDDGFVMKSGKNEEGRRRAMPTKNVKIRNCTVVNGHTLLGIGSELSGGIEDICLENCRVEGEVWKVLFIKSSRARGGWARNISVRNVTCERAKVCIFGIRTDYADTSYSPDSSGGAFLTPMENVVVQDVTVDHGWRVCDVDGFPELPPKGVVLKDVTLRNAQRGVSDIRNGGDLRIENLVAETGPFSLWCDKPDAKYACGETAVFSVVAHTNAGVAKVRLDGFGGGAATERTVDFAKTPRAEVRGGRDLPGFLLMTVTLGKTVKRYGVSFDRCRIAGGRDEPTDFEAFWRKAIEKYDREVPVDVKLDKEDALSASGCEVFRLGLSDPSGRMLSGCLKKPASRFGRRSPVFVTVSGADPCRDSPPWENAQYAELRMDVRCGRAADREGDCRTGAVLALCRAVKWLRDRPDVDPDRFFCRDEGRDGGIGLALMALDGRFRRGVVHLPARKAAHFDGVSLASMIVSPILFSACYADAGNAAHDVYAAYNACPAREKYVMDVVGFGPEGSRVESGEARRWLFNEDHEYTIPIANMTCPWSPWE